MAPAPLLSVVLTTYNRSALLGEALARLTAQTLPARKYEILVVDDGSPDATVDVVRAFQKKHGNVVYLPKPHEGLSAGRNFGIAHARGDLIAFTDDDCQAAPSWAEELLTTYQNEKPLGIEGKVITDEKKGLFGNAPENLHGGKYIGCNSAYTKTILQKVGGYDTRFFWIRDDSDMAFRVLQHGKIAFAERAVVYHPYRPTDANHLLKRLTIVQSDLLLFFKHPCAFLDSFGIPGFSNWVQSAAAYLLLGAAATLFPRAEFIAPLLAYAFFRFVVSMRRKTFSVKEGVAFILVLTLRDLLYPLAFVYFFFKTLLAWGKGA